MGPLRAYHLFYPGYGGGGGSQSDPDRAGSRIKSMRCERCSKWMYYHEALDSPVPCNSCGAPNLTIPEREERDKPILIAVKVIRVFLILAVMAPMVAMCTMS